MSDLVAAAEYNRRSVTPGSVQGNDGSFVTPPSGVTGGRNSVSPHPQAVTPPPNTNRPALKINIPNRSSAAGQMVREVTQKISGAAVFVLSLATHETLQIYNWILCQLSHRVLIGEPGFLSASYVIIILQTA